MPGNGSLQQMLDPTAPIPSSSAIPYAPTHRTTEAYSVLQPISRLESVQCDSTANTLRRFPKTIHERKKEVEVRVEPVVTVESGERLTGLAALPKRPGQKNGSDSNGQGNGSSGNDRGKRRRDEDDEQREREEKIRRTSQDVNTVQFHCKSRYSSSSTF